VCVREEGKLSKILSQHHCDGNWNDLTDEMFYGNEKKKKKIMLFLKKR